MKERGHLKSRSMKGLVKVGVYYEEIERSIETSINYSSSERERSFEKSINEGIGESW